jgi:serine/threonine protein kinase
MSQLDAAALAQQACMLGLVTEEQVRECSDEFSGSDAAGLLRVMERKGYLTPWHSQKLLKGDKDGYFLGGYRLLYRIASGTFGRVYRAEDPRTGEVVAVKVLRHRWSEDAHCIELFDREGKVGMMLKHAHIVRTLAVDQDRDSGQYYMVMEFVEGSNLRDFLGIRKKLPPSEALGIIQDATSGLAYAFSKGLTHRDIKLTNLLIATRGEAKLTDFGLATIYSQMMMNDDTKVERTVDYAGLEKATGVRSGDTRSDIYFLGCVLFEMLSGRPPLEMTKNKAARMARERFYNIRALSPEDLTAPQSVFRLVETMMQVEPQRRYQNPTQLLEAVKECRRDIDGKGKASEAMTTVTRTVFVVEANEKLQDVMRTKFKEMGFRVLLSGDPSRALHRYRQQPYDALVVDAGSTGEDSLRALRDVLDESENFKRPCACILMLSEDQATWADNLPPNPQMAIMVRPVTLRQLYTKINELLPKL